jgi:hypothetical protein
MERKVISKDKGWFQKIVDRFNVMFLKLLNYYEKGK